MEKASIARLLAACSGLLSLGACSLDLHNDGHMFQRWADRVAQIPVTPEEAKTGPRPALEPSARPPLEVEVVDAAQMITARAAGLREGLARPDPIAGAAEMATGLRGLVRPQDEAGAITVQLAAFRNQEAAEIAWRALSLGRPASLAEVRPVFEAADLGARGRWVRLKVSVRKDRLSALCAWAGLAESDCRAA